MKAFVEGWIHDSKEVNASLRIDPSTLAAKYCHRMVNIHPFMDGSGRTCRLLLNTILYKYTALVVAIGESGPEERGEYFAIFARSGECFVICARAGE